MAKPTRRLSPGLYVTATPIGNLGDITYRAVDTLKEADLILCEDTRHTAKLCAAYGIETPRRAYHDHNGEKVRPDIIRQLQGGATICLASDAGTPLISDPGYKLVKEARANDIAVWTLPGACAAIAGLSVSGVPCDQFFFAGFAPAKQKARETFLTKLKDTPGALIFYESPERLRDTLAAMADIFDNRNARVARELTKIYETVTADPLDALATYYGENSTKGEIVIIVEPTKEAIVTDGDIDKFLTLALQEMSVKDVASEAAATYPISKRDAYERALRLKNEK